MTTLSGTYRDFDIIEIIEDAYERVGKELRTAYDLITARRSMDFLFQEWMNNQVNLWRIDQISRALTKGEKSFDIPFPTIDVLDAVTNLDSGNDVPLERIPIEEYLGRPNKDSQGRPTHYAIERKIDKLLVYLWPVPDNDTYNFLYYDIKAIQEAGKYTNNPDAPRRFIPALVAGLAVKLAEKNMAKVVRGEDGRFTEIEGVNENQYARLERKYEALFKQARDEDRDRATIYLSPFVRRGRVL